MNEENVNQVDPTEVIEQVDTQVEQQASPASDVSGNEVTEESSESASTIPDNKEEETRKRLEGKLKQEQEEKKSAIAEREAYRKNILKTEDRAREYLEDSGLTKEQIETEISNFKKANPDMWKGNKPQVESETDRIQKIVSELPEVKYARELRDKAEKEKADAEKADIQVFFDAHPEYDPEKLDETKKKEVADFVVGKVGLMANAIKAINPGMKMGEAMIEAEAFLTNRAQKDVDRAHEDGIVEGLLTQAKSQSATKGGAIGGQTKSNGTYGLTDLEMKTADEFKMSYEEYAKFK